MARDLTFPFFSRIVGMDGIFVLNVLDGKGLFSAANVELSRAKDGATPAPQEECLTQASDPLIGSAPFSYGFPSREPNQIGEPVDDNKVKHPKCFEQYEMSKHRMPVNPLLVRYEIRRRIWRKTGQRYRIPVFEI